ncbi:MAG: hypothetical protein IJ912_08290 [Fibrobacter sp.]|nr:hypothetical protein [Fibrobacter sp.]MBR6833726.1 hypothetical protein [Fibrobacter sp.]
MKTKIASFLSIVALSLLTFATSSFADEEEGFYEKDHVRGFISIGADYRGMRSEYQRYVNTVALYNGYHQIEYTQKNAEDPTKLDTLTAFFKGSAPNDYKKFDDWYLGLHINVGAQYKQFLTWIDFNFMPTQVSERPASSYKTSGPSNPTESTTFPLYDVEWFTYGADWMFGWKLFGENAPINLIPSIGFGFSLMNMHFSSNYDYVERGNEENVQTLRDRFYSTLATTVNSELELRIELGRLALGGYLGYRFVRYNDMNHEEFNQSFGNHSTHHTDNVGDTYFFGIRATWYFLSQWEKKQQDKL